MALKRILGILWITFTALVTGVGIAFETVPHWMEMVVLSSLLALYWWFFVLSCFGWDFGPKDSGCHCSQQVSSTHNSKT